MKKEKIVRKEDLNHDLINSVGRKLEKKIGLAIMKTIAKEDISSHIDRLSVVSAMQAVMARHLCKLSDLICVGECVFNDSGYTVTARADNLSPEQSAQIEKEKLGSNIGLH